MIAKLRIDIVIKAFELTKFPPRNLSIKVLFKNLNIISLALDLCPGDIFSLIDVCFLDRNV